MGFLSSSTYDRRPVFGAYVWGCSHFRNTCNALPMRSSDPESGRFEVSLRRSRRARRPSLKVRPGQPPEVVLPLRAPEAAVARLLQENETWLREKLRWAKRIEDEAAGLGLMLAGVVWISGEPRFAPLLKGSGTPEAALERWYRRRARVALITDTQRIWRDFAQRELIHREPGQISVRDQRSRWGSCSARGNLSYSWRLVMMPAAVREYVVAHELCHLEVLNHSRRFWALLAEARPGWQAEAAWLRRFGPLLSLHSPAAGGGPLALPPPLPDVQ